MAKQEVTPEETTAVTALPPEGSYLPAMKLDFDWREVVRENIGRSGIDRFALPRLTVPAGGGRTWELPTLDGEVVSVSEVTGIIIHWGPLRAYWPVKFGEGAVGSPPTCSSNDGETGNGDPGGDCASCGMNMYGTAIEGRGKACKEIRGMFILPENALFPYYLQVPPSSLKGFKAFMVGLASRGISYWKTTVSLRLEQTKSADGFTYSKIVGRMVKPLSSDTVESIRQYRDEIRPALDASILIDPADFAFEDESE